MKTETMLMLTGMFYVRMICASILLGIFLFGIDSCIGTSNS